MSVIITNEMNIKICISNKLEGKDNAFTDFIFFCEFENKK